MGDSFFYSAGFLLSRNNKTTFRRQRWQVNEWVKQAILMYFAIQQMQTWDVAPFEFYDKMLLKKNYKELGT